MASLMTDRYLENNGKYSRGEALHKAAHPGKQPIQPAKRVAVVACMDARLDVEDLLGLEEQPNLPGTIDEHPNWRRRLIPAADSLLDQPDIAQRVELLASERPRL